MFCRKCGTELEQNQTVCPSCGENNNSEKTLKIIVTVVCVLLLAVVLSLVVMKTMGVGLFAEEKKPSIPVETTSPVQEGETTGTVEFHSYAVDDATAAASMDEVIATAGDYELTNGQFQIYYWFQVYNYYQKNAQYIYYGYLSLDYTKPLSEQPCAEDPSISWEEYFVNKALNQWHSYAIMNVLADEEGYEVPEDMITDMKADLQKDAQAAGFATIDDMFAAQLSAEVGPGTNVEEYWKYQMFVNRAGSFYADWYEKQMPTDDEVEAYYAENEKTFVDGGSGKDAGSTVDIRHILVKVDEATDENWNAAKAEADKILQEWKNGAATEESFAELANQYSDDDGSNTNGGLYAGVKTGEMVEVFNDWIFDGSRQKGDTAVLKADYEHYKGYHVMYFVASTPIWETAVKQTIMAEKGTTMLSAGLESTPLEKLLENVKLGQPYK